MKTFLTAICRLSISLTCAICCLVAPSLAEDYITDPDDLLMRESVVPFQPAEDAYGCGPLLAAGAAYHVSVVGDDEQDGRTPETAWRTLRHGLSALRAGDTLWIHEGEYYEPEALTLPRDEERSGKEGRPIRITAMPGARVIVTGARLLDEWEPVPDRPHVFQTEWDGQGMPFLWEADTHIEMQYGGTLDRAAELPSTFWVDEDAGRLYARFTRQGHAENVPGARVKGPETGLNIHAEYVLVRGLTFMNYGVGLAVRPGGRHVTIERCSFFATDDAGIQLSSAQRCLVRDNIARRSGARGGLFMHTSPRDAPDLADNLIIRNHFQGSRSSLRSGGIIGFAVHHWSGSGLRNHIIDNLLTGVLSLWYKPMHRQVMVQGNVLTGAFSSEGTRTLRARDAVEADRIMVRGNTLLGVVRWRQETWGPGGPGGDWIGPLKAFIDNIHQLGRTAEFADPTYYDYRLQADSDLCETALGGGLRGAQTVFRTPGGRVLFVDINHGDDHAAGTSKAHAWNTLEAAASRLQAGDTLYVLPGDYPEPLIVRSAGTEAEPIAVRAHGRETVDVPGIEIHGGHVTVEGFSVRQAPDDAVLVTAPDVTLRHLLAAGAGGAGVRARGASELKLRHCTLAGNATALALEQASTRVSLRDSILAAGEDIPLLDISPDSAGFMAGHNCYYGDIDAGSVARETGSIVANPRFRAPEEGDYKLQWNSPAAVLAAFAQPAGALPAAPQPISITRPEMTGILPDSAVVLWRTPGTDTFGTVRFREQGTDRWSEARSPELGTVHGAGLLGLEADSIYELQVVARGRRGGENVAPVQTFRTSADMPAPQTYYLAPEGNDSDDGLSPATAWRTTRRASQAVAPGDTVRIMPGEYHHVIAPLRGGLPGRRITFERYGEGIARLDGKGILAPLVSLVGKSYITIRGLDFDIGVGILRPGRSMSPPSPGGVMSLKDAESIEIIACRGGSLGPLGRTGGTNFIRAKNIRDLLIERCISWEARYHMILGDVSGMIMRNNTFVHSQIIAFVINGRAENITFYNNIFYRPCGMASKNNEFFLFRGTQRPQFESDYNLFFSPVENHRRIGVLHVGNGRADMIGEDLAQWQEQTGQELNSFRADPLFADFDNGDFRLLPDSPAIGAGRDGATIGALSVVE